MTSVFIQNNFLHTDRMEAKGFLMPVVLRAGFQVHFISTNLEESQSLGTCRFL